jgi:hypothetical protein
MTVTVTNLLAGPATGLWVGAFGATEPADLDTDPGVGWRDMGGTTGGVRLMADREFFYLDVDQIIGRVGAVPTQENFSVATSLAEPTLENYAVSLNLADDAVVEATGTKTLELGGALPGTSPNYRALIIDGRAPAGFRRRVIIRKVLSTASVEAAAEKAGQTVYPVTFSAFYVSASIRPVKKIDGTDA